MVQTQRDGQLLTCSTYLNQVKAQKELYVIVIYLKAVGGNTGTNDRLVYKIPHQQTPHIVVLPVRDHRETGTMRTSS